MGSKFYNLFEFVYKFNMEFKNLQLKYLNLHLHLIIMRSPKFVKLMILLPVYPVLYYAWVQQIKNTWIQNDIKDLHPQILFPQADRYKAKSSPYNIKTQFQDCLKFESQGLRQQYSKRLKSRQQKHTDIK